MENKTIYIPVEDKMSFKFSLFQSNPVKALIAFQRFLENVQAKKKYLYVSLFVSGILRKQQSVFHLLANLLCNKD